MTSPSHSDTDATPAPLPDAELLSLLLQRVPARVIVIDREHRYRWANAAALEFLCLPADRVIGHTIEAVRGARVFASYSAVAESLWAGQELHWEGWTDYPGRGRCYTEEWLLPVARPGEPVRAVIGFARDLTELRQHAQRLDEQLQALQRAEALKTAIVDNALVPIVTTVVGREGRHGIVEFNPAAQACFGIERTQALGRDVLTLFAARDREAHAQALNEVAAGTAAVGQRHRAHALRADGSEFPVEMVLWPTGVGGEAFVTASISDISERERAAAVIARQRDALRHSEKLGAMGGLLAGVAHELNNPLAIVMGRASLLMDKAGGGPLAEDAARIREAAERCGRIVRTFLNMARNKPAQRGPVVLNELVLAAAEMLQYGLRTHGIALDLQLEPELPAVHADADQIGQVVLNLMVNAQQAMTAEDAAGRHDHRLAVATGIEPRREGREPRVWLRVRDNGPGVPPALRERIFEPFFTTKPEGFGTGQGLAVSRSIAVDHGGHLVLEDGGGAPGASFRLSLPQSGRAGRAPASEGPLQLDTPTDAPTQRLLVVDDEAEIADLVRDFLESAGYEVLTAESGEVALELLQEAQFDAIVSDLRMPGIDGAGLWREVRQRWPALATRMLFVTGDTLSREAAAFLDEACCPSLDKPFARADLLTAVRQLLAARSPAPD